PARPPPRGPPPQPGPGARPHGGPVPPMSSDRWPRAELPHHLEGTTSPDTLWALAHANHVALPVATLAELRALYTFESFDHFIKLWLLMCSCLKNPADYERMVDGFVEECGRQ